MFFIIYTISLGDGTGATYSASKMPPIPSNPDPATSFTTTTGDFLIIHCRFEDL